MTRRTGSSRSRRSSPGKKLSGSSTSLRTAGKPVKQRYLAVIKEATYHENSGALTVTLDKVTWNPKYSDGNDEDPILNPVVKWETIKLGDVAVLVDAANGFQHLKRTDFPSFVRDDDTRARSKDGAGWRTRSMSCSSGMNRSP